MGGVDVVIDDKDAALPCRLGGCAAGIGFPLSSFLVAGSRTMNSLPLPGPSLIAVTLPPCISASERAMVRPMPSPPSERARERSPWAKSSNIFGILSGAIPMPVSRTLMTRSPSSVLAVSEIFPPLSVNLAAFVSKLTRICSSRVGSASRSRWTGVETVSSC